VADVFLSYSREDSVFVRQLAAALQARNREVWIDLEDILPSVRWREEIRAGITEADAVVFVITPDFVASEVCRTELDYAVEVSKRLIPIHVRETARESVPAELNELNWLSFFDGTDFQVGVDRLVEVLDTDIDRVRLHSRLLTRAYEWGARGRDRSLLLRGDELREAETWLANQTGRKPAATPAQAQLVLASRRAATRRQRSFVFTAAAAAVVMTILAIITFIQRQTAIHERQIAEDQTELATSRGLLAQAEARRDSNTRLSLQLGIAAYRIRPTPETYSSLYTTLLKTPLASTLTGHTDTVLSIAFSPDGRTLATAGKDATINLWDVTDSAHPTRIAILTNQVKKVVFSPDGHTLAAAGIGNTVELSDLTKRAHPIRIFTLTLTGKVSDVAFNPNGHSLATAAWNEVNPGNKLETEEIDLWDLTDGAHPTRIVTLSITAAITNNAFAVGTLAFSPDGRSLATASDSQTTVLWDFTDRGHPTRIATLTGRAGDMTFSSDGRTLATVIATSTLIFDNPEVTVGLWNVADRVHPTRMATVTLPELASAVAVNPDGRTLAIATWSGTVELWDFTDTAHPKRTTTLTGLNASVSAMAFNPVGRTLASGSFDNTVGLWALAGRVPSTPAVTLSDRVSEIAFSPDGRTLATASPAFIEDTRDPQVTAQLPQNVTIKLWDLTDKTNPTSIATFTGHTSTVDEMTFSPDGHTLATASWDHTVGLWDLTDRAHPSRIATLTGHSEIVSGVAFSPDRRTLATASNDHTVKLWDLTHRTHPTRGASLTLTGQESHIAFSPDGRTLAASSNSAIMILWDLADRARPSRTATFPSPATEMTFSPDGAILVTAGSKAVELWDLTDRTHPTRTASLPLTGQDGHVALSPDGRTMVIGAGTSDVAVGIWDITYGADPIRTATLTSPASEVVFGPDGYTLATIGNDHTAALWDLREVTKLSGHLIDRTCAAAGRDLSQQQWNTFAPEVPYRRTC
jgi:WD40 repeat protein